MIPENPIPMETDVVIIGGGIMGCSTAYYLAQAGVKVILLEKAPQVGQEASGVNAGGVRQNGRDPKELPLAMASIEIWKNLSRELGADLEYYQGGHMRLASTESEYAALAESVQAQQAAGLKDLVLLDEQEARKIVPEISPRFVGASYCPSDGHAKPPLVCPALAKAAAKHGAAIHLNTQVTGLAARGANDFQVDTPRGNIHARYVVNCAGAWSNRVAQMLGMEFPLVANFWQAMLSTPVPQFLKPVVTWTHGTDHAKPVKNINVKQLRDGSILISGAWTGFGDLNSMQRQVTAAGILGSTQDFKSFFSSLDNVAIQQAWVGVDGHVPDDVLCMGPVDEIPGFLFGGPGSGHSFALGPIVGKLLTEYICTGKTFMPIEALSPSRFKQKG